MHLISGHGPLPCRFNLQAGDAALATARETYIMALRMANKTLKSSQEAIKDPTLMASLLLDLFEKIADSEPRNNKS